jgi:hypothetical protein
VSLDPNVEPLAIPPHVASGELITSGWGNAVVDELARQEAAHQGAINTITPDLERRPLGLIARSVGPTSDITGFGGGSGVEIQQLTTSFPVTAGRTYRINVHLTAGANTVAASFVSVSLTDGGGAAQTLGTVTTSATGQVFDLSCMESLSAALTQTLTRKVFLAVNTGTCSYVGSYNRRAILTVEDVGRWP